ncbi:DUF421 domain-containing protein [Alkalicella caledoniensis]|uniref:DUF421 domain-containing protein n=1 Tax=Alkalicella caledoniensis TaxID=2731377 RepID=A0A7G9W8T9_ALKCA|nr:DUF421 domain-containing protein [Alkalicella caledoniensis]QNO15101.1 DUF421 domain-containing protein [Alkalicella caledoniensis]
MVDFFEVTIQTILAFFTILFITRLLGRQQISQLTLYEYINGITFGSIAATLATDLNQRTYQHFLGLILFGIMTSAVSFIALKNRPFRKVVEGEPILAIHDGKILEKNLKMARYSMDELNELLRKKDCFSINDVQYGVLEINGDLNIIKKVDKRQVTLEDINAKAEQESLATEIIIGGQIIYDNLAKKNITGMDLLDRLNLSGVKKVSEVMYCTIDVNGKIYIDKFDDDLEPNLDISENNDQI